MKKNQRERRKIAATVATVLSLLLLGLAPVRADDSDIFGANVEPNVMILIDSSGSMGDYIPSVSYDPATSYSGSYTKTKVYKRTSSGYTQYAGSVNDVNSTSARIALNSTGFWSGQIGGSSVNLYLGNYINYVNCTSCTGTQKKIVIAKEVITNLVNNVEGVRFGVMKFANNGTKGSGNAGMVAPIGTAKSDIVTAVNNISASGWTPTGEQLRDGGKYYSGTFSGYASPIQVECQPNFVIIISDGLQNGSINVVDQAKIEYEADHSSLTGTQNVIVHTVGFDIASNKVANDDLIAAAAVGGGQFFAANNSGQLALALQDAIRLIIESVFTFASPVVPTTSSTGSNRAYIAAFQSDASRAFWRGFLKAYARDTNGDIRLNPDGTPDSTYLEWDAGQKLSLKAAANRVIYKVNKSEKKLEAFDTTKVTPVALGVSTAAERDTVVNYVRGIDTIDEDGDLIYNEERAWKLGDIFHSTPVLVSPPLMPLVDSDYVAFRTANASRTSVVIVASNDGMLHAFRESDGEELWAFVPDEVIPKLKEMTNPAGEHKFYVDSSPIAADIKIDGTWKTIVVFGLKRGGAGYYGLDITDTTSPKWLWSFTDSNFRMIESWSEPAIGKIRWDNGGEKYAAFIGGGYDSTLNNNHGKAFYVIDLATGSLLAEYYNDGVTSDDRQYMNFSLAANPTAVDTDADGYIDRVYIGDVGGQLWKFEFTVDVTSSGATTYRYEFKDKDGITRTGDFTKKFAAGVTWVEMKWASDVSYTVPPTPCPSDCWTYDPATQGGNPEGVPAADRATDLGYVSLSFSTGWGNGAKIEDLVFVSEIPGVESSTFAMKGKRLFAADPSQTNPPAVGEYYPAQAIYGAPALSMDAAGNLWVYFGSGDRNHPRNSSSNRFYGIKDNTNMTNGNTLDESDLLKVLSTTTTVSSTVQGWYFVLADDEKVLASADVFNGIVFFTTFTISDSSLCGAGGGTAKLYAVQTVTGFAAMDFVTGDALSSTDGAATKAKIIGTGIPSKPQVVIDANGNPSVITGTTSQQVSSVPAPPISTKQLLGWREVF